MTGATQTSERHKSVSTCRLRSDARRTPRIRWAKLTWDISGRSILMSQINIQADQDLTTPFKQGSVSVSCLATRQIWLLGSSAKLKPIASHWCRSLRSGFLPDIHSRPAARPKELTRHQGCQRLVWFPKPEPNSTRFTRTLDDSGRM